MNQDDGRTFPGLAWAAFLKENASEAPPAFMGPPRPSRLELIDTVEVQAPTLMHVKRTVQGLGDAEVSDRRRASARGR